MKESIVWLCLSSMLSRVSFKYSTLLISYIGVNSRSYLESFKFPFSSLLSSTASFLVYAEFEPIRFGISFARNAPSCGVSIYRNDPSSDSYG